MLGEFAIFLIFIKVCRDRDQIEIMRRSEKMILRSSPSKSRLNVLIAHAGFTAVSLAARVLMETTVPPQT